MENAAVTGFLQDGDRIIVLGSERLRSRRTDHTQDNAGRDLGGTHREALDVLRRCHVDGLVTNVFLFDESKPAQRLESLTAFVGFVDSFAQQNGYTSARNVPGNVQIEFTGPATARILSSTEAPHFLTKGPPAASDRPTLDLVEARYVDTAKRDRDGRWRTIERDLILQQIWRGEGAYPFAAP